MDEIKLRTDDLELKELEQFIGSEEYHVVLGLYITDGVKYVMNNGYSWFITDSLVSIKLLPQLREQDFLCIDLKIKDGAAEVIISDGNGGVLYKQSYETTDGKRDLKLFFTDGVLMLSREY
jgi:hypothetical protein